MRCKMCKKQPTLNDRWLYIKPNALYNCQKYRAKDPINCKHPNSPNSVAAAYSNAVDENILEFINEVRFSNKKYIQPIKITKIDEAQAELMQELNGVDYTGYDVCLTHNAIEHIDKRHGKSGQADKSMANDENLARVGWVIDNFDSIELSKKKSRQYKNRDGSLADMFTLRKRINGYYYTTVVVPDADKKQMYVVSAYRNKS